MIIQRSPKYSCLQQEVESGNRNLLSITAPGLEFIKKTRGFNVNTNGYRTFENSITKKRIVKLDKSLKICLKKYYSLEKIPSSDFFCIEKYDYNNGYKSQSDKTYFQKLKYEIDSLELKEGQLVKHSVIFRKLKYKLDSILKVSF